MDLCQDTGALGGPGWECVGLERQPGNVLASHRLSGPCGEGNTSFQPLASAFLVLSRWGVQNLFVGVRVRDQLHVFVGVYLCLHSQTLEPDAVISVTRGLVSGPCSPPPSLLGLRTFSLMLRAMDATLCLSGPFKVGLPHAHGWSWIRAREQLGKTLSNFFFFTLSNF